MNAILYSIHHVLPLAVFGGLVLSLGAAFYGIFRKSKFTRGNRVLHLVTRVFLGVQSGVGLILYVLSGYPSAIGHSGKLFSPLGFLTIWHPGSMIAGTILINIGFQTSMKAVSDTQKHLRVAVSYGLGTLLICAGIPWS